MPSHTIYIPLADEPLWERATLQSDETMSSLFLQYLRGRFELEEEEAEVGKILGKPQSGEIFRSIRAELGMSQHELAHVLGTTQRSISCWETGSQPVSQMVLNHMMLLRNNRRLETAIEGIMNRKEHWQISEA